MSGSSVDRRDANVDRPFPFISRRSSSRSSMNGGSDGVAGSAVAIAIVYVAVIVIFF